MLTRTSADDYAADKVLLQHHNHVLLSTSPMVSSRHTTQNVKRLTATKHTNQSQLVRRKMGFAAEDVLLTMCRNSETSFGQNIQISLIAFPSG